MGLLSEVLMRAGATQFTMNDLRKYLPEGFTDECVIRGMKTLEDEGKVTAVGQGQAQPGMRVWRVRTNAAVSATNRRLTALLLVPRFTTVAGIWPEVARPADFPPAVTCPVLRRVNAK